MPNTTPDARYRRRLNVTNIATFRDQLMLGESIYFDLATLCEQAGPAARCREPRSHGTCGGGKQLGPPGVSDWPRSVDRSRRLLMAPPCRPPLNRRSRAVVLERRRRARRTQMDCYCYLRCDERSHLADKWPDVIASRRHAAMSNAGRRRHPAQQDAIRRLRDVGHQYGL